MGVKAQDYEEAALSFTLEGIAATITPTARYGEALWQWLPEVAGIYPVTVRVSDGVTDTSATFKIVVRSSNEAPVLTGLGNLVMAEGGSEEVMLTATDVDGNRLTYTGTSGLTKIEIHAVSEFERGSVAIYMGTKAANFEQILSPWR